MSVSPSRRLPWAALLLAVCLIAVASHFMGECLTHAAAPAADSPHSGYDLAEDQFVLAAAHAPSTAPRGLWGAAPILPSFSLAGFAPPVPPPDL